MKRVRLFFGTELPVLCILIFGLGPWVWMMLTSLRPDLDLTHSPISLIPSEFTLVHYIELLGRTSLIYNLRDSLIVASGAVTLGLLLSLPAAYAFSRFRFPGRSVLRIQFLVVNMFPVVLLVLPLFMLLREFVAIVGNLDRNPKYLTKHLDLPGSGDALGVHCDDGHLMMSHQGHLRSQLSQRRRLPHAARADKRHRGRLPRQRLQCARNQYSSRDSSPSCIFGLGIGQACRKLFDYPADERLDNR